jgi:hypothetical protein
MADKKLFAVGARRSKDDVKHVLAGAALPFVMSAWASCRPFWPKSTTT